jgi:type I restriction enzyme S subunit
MGKAGVIANNLFKFNFDKNLISPTYLFYCLKTERFKRFVERTAFGATMPALSFKKMNDFAIPIPPLELQQRFAAIVESVEQQKVAQRAHLMELDTLFAALQQRAFGGEL